MIGGSEPNWIRRIITNFDLVACNWIMPLNQVPMLSLIVKTSWWQDHHSCDFRCLSNFGPRTFLQSVVGFNVLHCSSHHQAWLSSFNLSNLQNYTKHVSQSSRRRGKWTPTGNNNNNKPNWMNETLARFEGDNFLKIIPRLSTNEEFRPERKLNF